MVYLQIIILILKSFTKITLPFLELVKTLIFFLEQHTHLHNWLSWKKSFISTDIFVDPGECLKEKCVKI